MQELLWQISKFSIYQAIYNDSMNSLSTLNLQVLQKIDKLSKLTDEYQQNQQKLFLKSFLNIMDRMSNDLAWFKQRIKDIDNQISAEKTCVNLAIQLLFFQNQCMQLKKQIDRVELQTQQYRMLNSTLTSKRQCLNNDLFENSKKQFKYKAKSLSLQHKLKNMKSHTARTLQRQAQQRPKSYFLASKQKNKHPRSHRLKSPQHTKINIYADLVKNRPATHLSFYPQTQPFQNMAEFLTNHQINRNNRTMNMIRSYKRNSLKIQ